MATHEIFKSDVRACGDRAAVFEYDGDAGYFYLYDTKGKQGQKVIAAIRVLVGKTDLIERDIAISWVAMETVVGLFIRGALWAAFDATTGAK
jgi:hypothetical protein